MNKRRSFYARSRAAKLRGLLCFLPLMVDVSAVDCATVSSWAQFRKFHAIHRPLSSIKREIANETGNRSKNFIFKPFGVLDGWSSMARNLTVWVQLKLCQAEWEGRIKKTCCQQTKNDWTKFFCFGCAIWASSRKMSRWEYFCVLRNRLTALGSS